MKIKILLLLVLMPSWLSSQTSTPIVNRSVNFPNRKPFYWKINWVDMTEMAGWVSPKYASGCIPIDEGLYQDNYMTPQKGGKLSSHWALNNTEGIQFYNKWF